MQLYQASTLPRGHSNRSSFQRVYAMIDRLDRALRFAVSLCVRGTVLRLVLANASTPTFLAWPRSAKEWSHLSGCAAVVHDSNWVTAKIV